MSLAVVGQVPWLSLFWAMYLLYIDESGDLARADDSCFVVGGVGIHESVMRGFQREIEAVVGRHLDPHLRELELHTRPMLSGSKAWRRIPKAVRYALIADLCRLILRFRAEDPTRFALFAVVRSPRAVRRVDPLERAFEELFLRFTTYVRNVSGAEEHAMVVADEAKYERTLQPLVTGWRTAGTRFGRLTRLIEVPLFVDSKASRLIQIADLVAHIVHRAYERNLSVLFDAMVPAFDAHDGAIHGLVHLTRRHSRCPCAACVSRRPPTPAVEPLTGDQISAEQDQAQGSD